MKSVMLVWCAVAIGIATDAKAQDGGEFDAEYVVDEYPVDPVDFKTRDAELNRDLDADRKLKPADVRRILELSDYLLDKRHRFRFLAARDLGRFQHKLAIPALCAVLRDRQEHHRTHQDCLAALFRIKDKRIIATIIREGLDHNLHVVRGDTMCELANSFEDDRPGESFPIELETSENGCGVLYPPEDPRVRAEYIEIWLKWWQKKFDTAKLLPESQKRGGF